jgi:hypothetical protein
MILTIILILLILVLIGAIPRWRYSKAWGYTPLSIIGLILVIYLVLVILGTIHISF